jgi:threonine synthase
MEYFECLFCDKKFPVDVFDIFCSHCREPMICYSPPGKKNFHLDKVNPLEKFRDFLPLEKIGKELSLGEGNSPLIGLNRLKEKYGLPDLYAKDESFNPTGSFKDMGTAVSVQKAVSLGINKIGTVSTGNMAASTAAYGARANVKTYVLVKEDVTQEKLLSAGIFGASLIKVKGDYGELTKKSFSIGKKKKIYFMNSVDPFRIEGYKMIGFEIFLQSNREAPQYIFLPVSAGGHIIGLIKAFQELKQQDLIQKIPTFVGVQAEGCSPLAAAFTAGQTRFQRLQKVKTIAQSISNPDPPAGNTVLKLIRENNGFITSVRDEDILKAQKELAQLEGIFCLPASSTTLAGLWKFKKEVKFDRNDKIILVITGTGLKSLKAIDPAGLDIHQASLEDLDATIQTVEPSSLRGMK